ncbi:MAG: hypothetical protein KJZ96_07815 [Rhodocyclaceae bacterium]|jgi:hypothetical protein|nr:hypothetical protein [Rhodocyclaceae bacterium]MCL4758241.1 hypothetical protein [Rhodocyclaceae bacterium]
MPYVKRDANGRIIALSQERPAFDGERDDGWQPVEQGDPDVVAFAQTIVAMPAQARVPPLTIRGEGPQERCAMGVDETDITLIRVLEDLIDTLIDRGIIRFTDLPVAAQVKLTERRSWRSALRQRPSLLDDDEHMI